MAAGIAKGSEILFLNNIMRSRFAELMELSSVPRVDEDVEDEGTWLYQGVKIHHVYGDAADLQTLRTVFEKPADKKVEAAIVLGTMSDPHASLRASSQDMRVLSTMTLLRKVHSEVSPGTPFRLIGENALDSTSKLALAPQYTGSVRKGKDFINTQGIYARSLIQALAYPQMHLAVAQLFHEAVGSPSLVLAPVGHGSLPGLEILPCVEASFADVTRVVAARCPGAICIGCSTVGGEIHLAPGRNEVHKYEEGDLLILIRRPAQQTTHFSAAASSADPVSVEAAADEEDCLT